MYDILHASVDSIQHQSADRYKPHVGSQFNKIS